MPSLQPMRRPSYICTSCIDNLLYTAPKVTRTYVTFRTRPGSSHVAAELSLSRFLKAPPHLRRNAYSTAVKKPMRLAIIGSGPAGFYAAHHLMSKVQDVVVDMYEKLPVPYGLVRFGVAPDHPEVKNCQDTFEEVASSSRFNYIGNVEVGETLALADMKPHYDAMLFAYGASEDRKLGIPGEDALGVYSAREFVGWYNGHPQFSHLKPELDRGEDAVIVGQGNVALDVARILVSPLGRLRQTDIAEHALEALSRRRIKRVQIVGRRGPLQASFTAKEARELMHFPTVGFKTNARSLYPPEIKSLPRVQRRIAEVLLKGTPPSKQPQDKKWTLAFMQSPKSICISKERTPHVTAMEFSKTAFAPDTDPLSKDARVIPTEGTRVYEASCVFKSIGYKSTALRGLSDLGVLFDDKLGIIPNDEYGRIMTPARGPGELSAGQVPGLYCVGWVKRGPTGVIASTMQDAFTTAEAIAQDWATNVPFLNTSQGENQSSGLGWDGVKDVVLAKGVVPVDWAAWKRIDAAEQARGKEHKKVREKFASTEEQLKAAFG